MSTLIFEDKNNHDCFFFFTKQIVSGNNVKMFKTIQIGYLRIIIYYI